MNLVMQDVLLSFELLAVHHVVIYQPPPLIGGYVQNVDVIADMFELWTLKIQPHVVFDCVDRAVGSYERESQRLFRGIFNPLYWIGALLVWLLRLPFRFLTAAGFDGAKIESSLVGKIAKVVLSLIPLLAAALKIADDWDKVRSFLQSCVLAVRRVI